MAKAMVVVSALLFLMVAIASVADADRLYLTDQPRRVFIQNKIGQRKRVAVMCWLNGHRVWKNPIWLWPGKEVVLKPEETSAFDYADFKCAVWTPFIKKWCLFTAYESNVNYGDCMGYGCRWLLKRDGIYYGIMQDELKKYTGGPYRKVRKWCR